MRLMNVCPAALLAAGAMALAADQVPAPPQPGIVPPGATSSATADQPANGPTLSPPVFEQSPSREVENMDVPAVQPAVAPMNQPASPPAVTPPVVARPDATYVRPAMACGPVVPAVTAVPVYAPCPTSVCGPFGPPQFGNAPGPGTGVAVPPVPPAYLAAPTGFYASPVCGIHDRYPYYSYRRPWYTAGPASANVTIVW
jgi:hypothetical protein